jgi:hypothetical protein
MVVASPSIEDAAAVVADDDDTVAAVAVCGYCVGLAHDSVPYFVEVEKDTSLSSLHRVHALDLDLDLDMMW